MSIKQALSKLQTYSKELDLDLSKSGERFKWFLASVLFAKRISADIAKKTFCEFEQEELATPEALMNAGWDNIVTVLDAGGYTRYDFSTATNLLAIAKKLKEEYGDLEKLYSVAQDSADLEKRLLDFRGVGPVAVNIFLRELRGTWQKADPKPSPMAMETAAKIGLSRGDVQKYESQLVRLNLEYCKKHKSFECPLKEMCADK